MAISLFDVSVTSFLQTVGAVEGYLAKGLAHCRETGLDPETLVETRLAEDMLPFRFQVLWVALHTQGALEAVSAGAFSPPREIPEVDYAGLQARIAETRVALQVWTPAQVNALEGRDMVFAAGERKLPFTAEGFLMSFSLPNLHFHATTAYDILRQAGVPVGKRDYLGHMRLKS